ncbi:hypothetical protein CPT_Peacock_001 [Escherichia phage Peacock]|uniref:Uncharacterized protein n=1 Tax=Escherichia phage Peacock TaxID=2591100 RepID=A0A5B9NFQ9_9CAUD|nr:hypothetical protein CPT_Peacock_001 [Escherichia phage Peacock]
MGTIGLSLSLYLYQTLSHYLQSNCLESLPTV